MKTNFINKNTDLIIFTLFSLIFSIMMEYLAYLQFSNELKSLSILTAIGGLGFTFVAVYSLFKLKELGRKHSFEIDKANSYDTLTSIPNIYSFISEINKQLTETNNTEKSLFLIKIGINRFKFINDTFGSAYADEILILIKDQIKTTLVSDEYFSRLNGDEFGIIAYKTKPELKELIMEIKSLFSKDYKTTEKDLGVYIKIRLGIVENDKKSLDRAEDLIRKSTISLDYSKKEGLFYKIYDKTLEKETNKILEMEKDLRLAIEKNEIDVFFQPKISVKTGKVIGAEALARWYSKKRKSFIPPNIFIEMAEDIGVIESIGNFVLSKSAIELKKWHRLGYKDLKVAVNVSTHQFKKELPENILNLIYDTELLPSDIEVEVTESAIITDKESGKKILNKIQISGVTIAIDDFGTGYSSLGYLIDFPLDIIKIDKSFIDKINCKDLETREKGRNIVSTIIHLAHSLNCKVVAEGVETKIQNEYLKTVKCDYIQGYYYSKPLKSDEFISYLKNKNK